MNIINNQRPGISRKTIAFQTFIYTLIFLLLIAIFPIRAAKGWNELPENVKNSTSINGFKSAYDKWKNTKTEKADD